MAKISDFFEKLASDDDFAEDFDDTPVAVMKAFGLDKRQRDLVRNGTAKEIRTETKTELGKDVIVIMVKMH
jgi:hypothetical protein